jgi:hypothetical protein
MHFGRAVLRAVLASGFIVSAANGQAINYTTEGFFSGPGTTAPGVTCTAAPLATASCTGGGFNLLFTGVAGLNLANNTITSLGTFDLTGTGTVTVPSGFLLFTLLIQQTTPSMGTGTFAGSISGTVSTAGGVNFSSLIWTPNQFVTIAPVKYQIIYDNIGPAADVGLGIPINNARGIDALVTVTSTPEPGTITLLATGLVVLVAVGKDRRKRVVLREGHVIVL